MRLGQVENEDWHVVVQAEGKRGRIHDVEALLERVDEGDLVVFHRVGVFFRILVVDAVDLGGLENDIGMQLARAERRGRVSGEVGIAGAGDEDDYAALFEVAHGAAEDERLGNLVHRDGALHAGVDAELLEAIHERETVDDRGEHAHVVAGGAVDPALLAVETAKDVAAADDDADLHAECLDLLHLLADLFQGFGVDRIAGLAAAQHLAGKLEHDALVFRPGIDLLGCTHSEQETIG